MMATMQRTGKLRAEKMQEGKTKDILELYPYMQIPELVGLLINLGVGEGLFKECQTQNIIGCECSEINILIRC